jgi:hypothetical protein
VQLFFVHFEIVFFFFFVVVVVVVFDVLLGSLPVVLCCWVIWVLRSLSAALPC